MGEGIRTLLDRELFCTLCGSNFFIGQLNCFHGLGLKGSKCAKIIDSTCIYLFVRCVTISSLFKLALASVQIIFVAPDGCLGSQKYIYRILQP